MPSLLDYFERNDAALALSMDLYRRATDANGSFYDEATLSETKDNL